MKKLFSLLVLLALATSAHAGGWVTGKLINGQFLVLSNNYTASYLDTNLFYVDNVGIARWSFTLTNLVPTTGQSGTNFNPAANYYTNTTSFTSTNSLAGGYNTNGGGYLNAGAFATVEGTADGFGKTTDNALLSVTCWGLGSIPQNVAGAPTNTVTVTLVKGTTSTNFASDSVVNYDTLVLAFAGSCQSNAVFTTNIPPTFMTGARRIGVKNITTSNVSSGTNVILGDISVTMWAP